MKVSVDSIRIDVKATEEFLETLDELIVEQIFNMDETSIFWKQIHEWTFFHRRPISARF